MTIGNSTCELEAYIEYATLSGDSFALSILENLSRYPVSVSEFITGEEFLGLRNVYPEVISALEDIYHPSVEGMQYPLRFGSQFREVLLTGGIGCAKTYASVLGLLYGIYLLSCLREPHGLYGLDSNSEIVVLFQSLRSETGGIAYRLCREIVEGSKYFTRHFPKNPAVKNEMQFSHNIVIRAVSGEVTAAIGMNIIAICLDEVTYMYHRSKSVYGENGGEFDQAQALYNTTRSRVDSRFAKRGRYMVPMWLAGSARHEEDFIQAKIRDIDRLRSQGVDSKTYVYDKRIWEVKPWDYPSGDYFRVYKGKGAVPPGIVEEGDANYNSEHVIDVPIELETVFKTQPINIAMRDICGLPSSEIGNFVVEVERAKSYFNRRNMFTTEARTFQRGDLPQVWRSFLDDARRDRTWFCHLDLSRSNDSTGMAFGFVDKWVHNRPQIIVEGLLEVPATPGSVIPWNEIINQIFRMSNHIPVFGIGADQVGYHFLAENVVPWGFRIAKISDNARSEIFHKFLNTLMEGDISIAKHDKTINELLALSVDEKTGKVSKPAGGSKDCIDALVSLVELLKTVPRHLHDPSVWQKPVIPDMEKQADGSFLIVGGTPLLVLPDRSGEDSAPPF